MKTKINEIAKILELENNSNPEETNQTYYTLKLTNLVNMSIYHDTYRKKLNVSLTYSKTSGLSYSTCYASFDGIYLSDNREASSLARDIKRRILIERCNEVDEYCQKIIDWNPDKSMYFTLSAKELSQDQIEQILKIAGF